MSVSFMMSVAIGVMGGDKPHVEAHRRSSHRTKRGCQPLLRNHYCWLGDTGNDNAWAERFRLIRQRVLHNLFLDTRQKFADDRTVRHQSEIRKKGSGCTGIAICFESGTRSAIRDY